MILFCLILSYFCFYNTFICQNQDNTLKSFIAQHSFWGFWQVICHTQKRRHLFYILFKDHVNNNSAVLHSGVSRGSIMAIKLPMKRRKEVREQQESSSEGCEITKRKLQCPCHGTRPCCHHSQEHPPSPGLASRRFLFNLLHDSHVKCANLQGAIFSSGKLSTNLCFSPGRALSRSDKSFLRETDWNNGGDYTLNGFLLCCSARSSTASEEQRERERKRFISWTQRTKQGIHRVNESERDT